MSAVSAALFDEYADRVGANITGRRTYDVAGAWSGTGPLPGTPLFVVTHQVPDTVPAGASRDHRRDRDCHPTHPCYSRHRRRLRQTP
jgi:hypothetical protein